MKIFLLVLISFLPATTSASCVEDKRTEITIIPRTCEIINPSTNTRILQAKINEQNKVKKYGEQYAAKWLTDNYYKEKYTGALITNDKGWEYFYKSDLPNICGNFSQDKPITKKINSDCCDTGAWGNCIFGGNFIYD